MDRLVVIDDEVELGRFVGRVAESVGYDVKVTSRVQDFKDAVNDWNPSVIILDLAMPDADGLELLRWMASENRRTKIIIMSGHDARVIEAAKRIGQERGLDISLTFNKPIRMQELKKKLESLKKLSALIRQKAEPVQREDLDRCLMARELFLVYQPKIVMKTGILQGVEALVRWCHPTRGVLMPGQFIELAEKTGLIDPLTDFVLSEAIHQQKTWAATGLDIQVAVNLSPLNLRDESLADRIDFLCRSENILPDRLVIEISESAAMSNALEALDILTRLRIKGFKISIDDFGTGFSSLARLRRLPVTEIKIDRSFVSEILSSTDASVIVKTVISMAQNMNLTSVAEGVETEEHYRVLMELGCDLGQGYGIARPMNATDLVQWNQKLNPTNPETTNPKPDSANSNITAKITTSKLEEGFT